MCHHCALFFRETAHFLENSMAVAEIRNVKQRRPHILTVVSSSSDLLHDFVRNKHVPRIKSLIQLLLSHQTLLQNDIVDRAIGFQSFLGHLRTRLVTDIGIQCGYDTDGVLHHFITTFFIDGNTEDTLFSEGFNGVLQPQQTLDERLGDNGLHHVKLQLTGFGSEAYGGVVTNDLETNLVHHLGDYRVHLSWHDAGTGSLRGEVDLVKTATRTRGHEAEVVTDLGELDGQTFQG